MFEAQSVQGNLVNLGKVRTIETSQYLKHDFLKHDDGPRPPPHNKGTLNFTTTVCNHNFLVSIPNHNKPTRRPQTSIVNDNAYERSQHALKIEERNMKSSHARSEALLLKNTSTGYNIITGNIIRNDVNVKHEGLKYIKDGMGPETMHRGKNNMKDSSYRFFAPDQSGPKHNYRQTVLVNNGLLLKQKSSIIQLGKPDMESFGVEDQFSKNKYTSVVHVKGLVEATVPGKYTPRQQNPNVNPSADERVRDKWTTGFAIGKN